MKRIPTESMESDPIDSAIESAHRSMRSAWIVLTTVVIVRILNIADFEWQAYRFGNVEFTAIDFFFGLFYFIVFMASIAIFIRLVVKRAFAPAFVYAIVLGVLILPSFFGEETLSFGMKAKARLFASFPSLCQHPFVPGRRVSICYSYRVDGGSDETLYFNPGDEMSLPASQWPDDIKRMFVGKRFINSESEDDLCANRIVDHIYWRSGDCWRKTN